MGKTNDVVVGNSELRRIFTEKLFEKAYSAFIEQADKNSITKKAHGPKSVPGIYFPGGGNMLSGAPLSQHFGQGAASSTPYISWWVVSVYYVVENGSIVVGIEKDRYPHIKDMNPLRYMHLGNKKTDVAIFYETTKEKLDYKKLYKSFIDVSEEVMEPGLR